MKTLQLEDLSIEQKVGQLIVARSISDPKDFDFAMGLIRDNALGGVQANPCDGVRKDTIDPVLNAADYPIFIAADMERGFQLGDLQISSNLSLGILGNVKDTYDFARITATQAKQWGYNMIWSPVVDMIPFDSPIRTLRSFGSDKELVARMCCAYVRAFSDCGVIGAVKHFPSVTDMLKDTHMEQAVSYQTKEELLNECLYPYRKVIEELGSDMMGVMTTHVQIVNVDPVDTVTVSKASLDLLREIGFDGLTITDSLAMMGIIQRYGDEQLPGLAVAAGHDLVLPNYRIPLKDAYYSLLNAFKNGVFDEGRLNEACSHVLRAQARTSKQPAQAIITQHDRDVIDHINRDSICAVTDPGVNPAIDPKGHHLFVILKSNQYDENDAKINPEIGFPKVWKPELLAKQFLDKFPNSDVLFICEFPHAQQNESVCAAAPYHDDVVFVTFCESAPYQGIDGLSERVRYLIQSMAYHVAAIVHVGNPFALESVVHVPRRIFGFPHQSCIERLPSVLVGETKATGKLPINIKLR